MTEEDEKPKLTKTEEKESFLKSLDEKISEHKKVLEEMQKLTERNEELATRNLLGGKTDAGIQPVKPAVETPAEYAKRVMSGKL